ncbi:MAG TPA: hypothetical protein VEX37_04360 [Thermomicrobiales bacterium]|nr:hypothetical protein [Thermomicrobiales bacterium]
MRGKEVVLALMFTLAGAALAVAGQLALGDRVSSVVYYAVLIIGLGAALVTVRIGRIGPFEGELGSLRLEMDVRDRIMREADRASRYDRDFSVLAIRQPGAADRWREAVRGADDMIICRRNLVILLLPETSRGGALMLLRRAMMETPAPVQAALVSTPLDGRSGDELLDALLALVRESAKPGAVVMRGVENIETLPIGA